MHKLKTCIVLFMFIFASLSLFAADENDFGLPDMFKNKETDKILKLLQQNLELSKTNIGDGDTPLHYAAYYKNLDVVNFIIKDKTAVDIPNERQHTPLYYAILTGSLEITKLLVEAGADPNAKFEGEIPLVFIAAQGSDTEILKYMLSLGIDVNISSKYIPNLLYAAAQRGNLESVKFLQSRGLEITKKTPNEPSIMVPAVISGNADLINYLIQNGLDVNAADERGRTPLDFAINFGKPETVKLIIDAGANVNTSPEGGLDPLTLCVKKGQTENVNLMLNKKASFKTDKNTGKTVLQEAALRGNSEIVKVLLDAGMDINEKDKNGLTALSYAYKYGNKDVVDLLKASGADEIECEDNTGENNYLKKELKDGQAFIWYLRHSGWAIKTKNKLMIFDYWDNGSAPTKKLLANGYINPEELKDLDVYIFVTHQHRDHFDRQILSWQKEVPSIRYIFGFEFADENIKNTTSILPRQQMTINGIEITTIKSNDSGVGFAVKVDGITFFHAGDHANSDRDNSFFPEIDFLAEKGINADVAFFLNMYGCGSTEPEAFQKGIFYTLDKLHSKWVFPMHANDKEWVYKDLEDAVKKADLPYSVGVAVNPGDRFFIEI
ncbi:MAG: ankyrin repeat domain-containing protein [Acidobacteria bacterium]|nr:ankyrin repeat domain-containing protein [Acidobacteriota bacterium]